MSAQAWAYFSNGGVANEHLLPENQDHQLAFLRILNDFKEANTRFSILGKEYRNTIFSFTDCLSKNGAL